jgi:hypothetical protein
VSEARARASRAAQKDRAFAGAAASHAQSTHLEIGCGVLEWAVCGKYVKVKPTNLICTLWERNPAPAGSSRSHPGHRLPHLAGPIVRARQRGHLRRGAFHRPGSRRQVGPFAQQPWCGLSLRQAEYRAAARQAGARGLGRRRRATSTIPCGPRWATRERCLGGAPGGARGGGRLLLGDDSDLTVLLSGRGHSLARAAQTLSRVGADMRTRGEGTGPIPHHRRCCAAGWAERRAESGG